VLGGDRAAHPQHDGEHDGVDLVPPRKEVRGVGADRLADIVMDVAVAEMAERHRPRAGISFITAASASAMKIGYRGDGTETSCLIEPPSGFCAADISSRSFQNAPRWLKLVAITASSTMPSSMPRARIASSASRASSRDDDNSISTYQDIRPTGAAHVDAMADAEIDGDIRQQLKTGEAAGRLVLRYLQQF